MFAFEYAEDAIQAGRASVSAHLDRIEELLGELLTPSSG